MPTKKNKASGSSAGYSDRLSQGHSRGDLNLMDKPDAPYAAIRKARILAHRIRKAEGLVVLHTGAGLSTAAGVSDFRGPNGIWTREQREARRIVKSDEEKAVPLRPVKKRLREDDTHPSLPAPGVRRSSRPLSGPAPSYNEEEDLCAVGDTASTGLPATVASLAKKDPSLAETNGERVPNSNTGEKIYKEKGLKEEDREEEASKSVPIELAEPTLAHMVIAAMVNEGYVSHIVSQNVDGLHLRSGVPRERLSELHGNLFREWCASCELEVERDFEIQSAGLKPTGNQCPKCGGELTDKTLDWGGWLPDKDIDIAKRMSKEAKLNIAVGSSLQMQPSMTFPFCKGDKMAAVIINLSETQKDKMAGMVIRAPIDEVFSHLASELGIKIPIYSRSATFALDVERSQGADVLIETSVTLRTANGVGKMPIPFVQDVTLSARTLVFKPDRDASHFSFSDLTDPEDAVEEDVSADVFLRNGLVLTLKVKAPPAPSFVTGPWETTVVQQRSYQKQFMKILKDTQAASMNVEENIQHSLQDFRSWFIKNGTEMRHVNCVVCYKNLYGAGSHNEPRLKGHIKVCLRNALLGKSTAPLSDDELE